MENLTGSVVLVHPELENDPAMRQGLAGTVASADLAKDEIYVGFGSGLVGQYSAGALLALKSHHEIYKDLLTHVQELDPQDFKAMLRISMLLESGSPKQQAEAMELAMTSYQTLARSTVPLAEKLNLVREESQEQEQAYAHTR